MNLICTASLVYLALFLGLGLSVHSTHFETAHIAPGECVKHTEPIVHQDIHNPRHRHIYTYVTAGIPDSTLFTRIENSNSDNELDKVVLSQCNLTPNEITVPEMTIKWVIIKEK